MIQGVQNRLFVTMSTLYDKIRGNVFASVRFLTPIRTYWIIQRKFLQLTLLGAAELHTFILSHIKIYLSYRCSAPRDLSCSNSLYARLHRVSSALIQGRLNFPMSLNSFPLIQLKRIRTLGTLYCPVPENINFKGENHNERKSRKGIR
jgi:hypothetical protein